MSRIISIHSFRGGTGKSNITANIAPLLAAEGRRVGVIDTHPGLNGETLLSIRHLRRAGDHPAPRPAGLSGHGRDGGSGA